MRSRCNNLINSLMSRLLIVTIIMATFLPAHYHLHHISGDENHETVASHDHIIDVHVITEIDSQSHHDDAISVEVSPDGIVKKITDYLPLILSSNLLSVLSTLDIQADTLSAKSDTSLWQRIPHLNPPLRAPPGY